ncbi:MAG: hypothetical protein HWD59_14255 [Coxiellaceae bacterium]|nr:MAG: hypothetical protein HWD59_14255 [Coxiellaceae bacterium]
MPELLYQTVITKLGNTMATWRIMDLGCGTGLAGAKFRPLAQTLIGVDLFAHGCDC